MLLIVLKATALNDVAIVIDKAATPVVRSSALMLLNG